MVKNIYLKRPLIEIYGENSFNDALMKERLPKNVYDEFKKVQNEKTELTREVAEVIANAMKDWAIERGATHYTHWFQPLTGLTAEKHDSFISPTNDGKIILEFSGKELIKGEPDASSFPNGGLRSTFEARGYTAWDTTSPAFLREDNTGVTLYIPTAFVSYTGEALDKKVPLLRSMVAINKHAMRILKKLGNKTSKRVITTVGAEQEYFLIDKEYYDKRADIMLSGRALFGAMPAKGQELGDHYFGTIKERVADFMREFDYELWKLGIPSKTKHNEVAPNQFEVAPIYSTSNVATDGNNLLMDTLKKVASRHNLVALLHEKPFKGVNGSGKHNNWSMSTDDGINLLEPGDNPQDNAQFLLFVMAVIEAVDRYSPLLSLSAVSAGNDHRLGGNEAPPSIISIFLGEQLTDIYEKLSMGEKQCKKNGGYLEIGVDSLPKLPKDLTDRNRTSPLAFTGNKFEFRMVGSSDSIAGSNVMLNTVVADVLNEYADKLENAIDINDTIRNIIVSSYIKHKKIIFNGNGYSENWIKIAKERGLLHFKSTVDVFPYGISDMIFNVFKRQEVLTKEELISRNNIYAKKYSQQINIEASIMIQIANTQIFPAVSNFAKNIAISINEIKNSIPNIDLNGQKNTLQFVVEGLNSMKLKTSDLEKALEKAHGICDEYNQAKEYKKHVIPLMEKLREISDNLEKITDKNLWPFPTYEELLFKL